MKKSIDKTQEVLQVERALKLALEFIEANTYGGDDIVQLMTAIREALAEQCVCGQPDTPGTHRTDGPCLAEQPAQQQEPVAKSKVTGEKT